MRKVDAEKNGFSFESSQPVDIAAASVCLDDEEMQSLVDLLPSSSIAELASNADEELGMRIAVMLVDSSLLVVIGRMRDDDAADFLGGLPRERVSRLLSQMSLDEAWGLAQPGVREELAHGASPRPQAAQGCYGGRGGYSLLNRFRTVCPVPTVPRRYFAGWQLIQECA